MKQSLLVYVLSMSVIFISGCTTPAVVKLADNSMSIEAKKFESESDRAKIYFVNGKVLPNLFQVSHQLPMNIVVNDILVGSMNPENVMVMAVKPGEYRFSWNPRSTDLIVKNTESIEFLARVDAGEVVVLYSDYDQGSAALFGLLGSMISPPKATLRRGNSSEVGEKSVVTPQICPKFICLSPRKFN